MLDFLLKILGDPNEKKIKNMMGIVDHINALEPQFAAMSDDELRAKTDEFKEILDRPETSAPSEQIEQEDQKQEGSSEAASAQPETGPDYDQTE